MTDNTFPAYTLDPASFDWDLAAAIPASSSSYDPQAFNKDGNLNDLVLSQLLGAGDPSLLAGGALLDLSPQSREGEKGGDLEKRKASGDVEHSTNDYSGGDDHSASDSGQPAKKNGRKGSQDDKDTEADVKQKRKAQNRLAQRAFRERKEKYVKELEDKIKAIEAEKQTQSETLKAENAKLKQMVAKLQQENYTLKGANFTFDFPIERAHRKGELTPHAMTVASVPPQKQKPHQTVPSPHDTWTPPSSEGRDSIPTSPAFSTGQSNSPDSDSLSTFTDPSSPNVCNACGKKASKPNTSCSEHKGNCKYEDVLASDIFDSNGHLVAKSTKGAGLANDKQALFNNYRDPSPFFNQGDLDPLFQDDMEGYNGLGSLMSHGEGMRNNHLVPDFATISTHKTPSHHREQHKPVTFASATDERFSHAAHPDLVNPEKKMISTDQVWERVTAHPKFEEIDMDLLCEEMHKKAKCTGSGSAVVDERDVEDFFAKAGLQ